MACAQDCCKLLKGLSALELVTLASIIHVLNFQLDDTVIYQGEPATFFAVVLEGSVAPVVNMKTLTEASRGVGSVVGELALFAGGVRQASLIGTAAGFLAVFRFDELTRLRNSSDASHVEVAKKLNHQLARAALSKNLEAEGRALAELSEIDVQEMIVDLRLQQAAQNWTVAAGSGEGKKQEMLFIKKKLNSAAKKVRSQGPYRAHTCPLHLCTLLITVCRACVWYRCARSRRT